MLAADAPVDSPQLESQIQILKSKAIATLVINQLRLADDPEFMEPGRSWRSIIKEWFGGPHRARPVDPMDWLVDNFDKRLTAIRLGFSTVIEISFSAGSAERSAEIANAIANAYVTDQLNAKLDANRTATAWLQDRLKELGQQALTAERAVNAFKSQNNIVAAGGRLMDDERVAELNSRLVAVRAQTSEALARLNRFETILASNSADSASIGSLDASGSDALSNPIINNLRQQYLENARREIEYSGRLGSDHLAVVNLRTQMRGIRASILDEVRRLAETSRSDFEVAKQRQQEIEKQLALAVSQSRTTNSAELTMRELETSAKGYRSLYESFLQRDRSDVASTLSVACAAAEEYRKKNTPASRRRSCRQRARKNAVRRFRNVPGRRCHAVVPVCRIDSFHKTRDRFKSDEHLKQDYRRYLGSSQ